MPGQRFGALVAERCHVDHGERRFVGLKVGSPRAELTEEPRRVARRAISRFARATAHPAIGGVLAPRWPQVRRLAS